MELLRIGMVGLDTSHAPAFAKILNDPTHPYHVPGGRVVAAFSGGSPDFALSWNRVQNFTEQVQSSGDVQILDSPAAVTRQCDAVLLTSVDGRAHRELFEQIAPFKKPVFIDKPFAVSSGDAHAIAEIARENGVPLMSCSTLRYAQPLVEALAPGHPLLGADCSGPMELEETQPGLFWYGIHSVEMLFAALGRGCERVQAVHTQDSELVTGVWKDGRIGTVRGYRGGKKGFGALLHETGSSRFVDATDHPKPVYAGLLEQVLPMFRSGTSPIPMEETLEIVAFIEAANLSRISGESVPL